jgi:SAM-dependent methyltransferase
LLNYQKQIEIYINHLGIRVQNRCVIEKCGIEKKLCGFLQETALRPGGWRTFAQLLDACQLEPQQQILELACSSGNYASRIVKLKSCLVVSLDNSKPEIKGAVSKNQSHKTNQMVKIIRGNLEKLPFSENEFNAVVSQFLLVRVKDKLSVIREAARVLKPGGYLGSIEYVWRKEPSRKLINALSGQLAPACLANAGLVQDWENILRRAGIKPVITQTYPWPTNASLLAGWPDNQWHQFLRILWQYLSHHKFINYMEKLNGFFQDYSDYFGYGIFIGQK